MNEGHVEYDKRLNWIGVGVFLTLFVIGGGTVLFLSAVYDGKPATRETYLLILGLSALIGLTVHVCWQLLLYPYVVYKIRRLQGDTPKQALLYFLRFLVVSLIVGALGFVLAGLLGDIGVPSWAIFALAVLGAWQWDRQRKGIRTVDVLSKSRELSLK